MYEIQAREIVMCLETGTIQMPAHVKSLVAEWKPLAAKIQAGSITEAELDRLDALNQKITAEVRKLAH